MKFTKIYVEITNICNLNCSFCSKDNRLKEEMTLDNFKIVLDKIKDYTKSIYLHIKGEPLLYSKLDKLLSICDDYNMKVKITTNGTLLKDKKEILKKHSCLKQLNISLHSENNKKDYFEDVFKVADELKNFFPIVYRIWLLDNLTLDILSTKIVDKIIFHYNLDNNFKEEVIKNKNIKIDNNLYLDKDNYFEWPSNNVNNNDVKGTCLGTRSHIAILVNGDVVPCCLDSNGILKLGNIFNDDLEYILKSDKFLEIHNGFINNVNLDIKNLKFKS